MCNCQLLLIWAIPSHCSSLFLPSLTLSSPFPCKVLARLFSSCDSSSVLLLIAVSLICTGSGFTRVGKASCAECVGWDCTCTCQTLNQKCLGWCTLAHHSPILQLYCAGGCWPLSHLSLCCPHSHPSNECLAGMVCCSSLAVLSNPQKGVNIFYLNFSKNYKHRTHKYGGIVIFFHFIFLWDRR